MVNSTNTTKIQNKPESTNEEGIDRIEPKASRLFSFKSLKNRDTIFFIIRIVIALSAIFYLVSKLGTVNLLNIFRNTNYFYLSIVLLLLPFNLLFQYLKWASLVDAALGKYSRKKIVLSLFYGLAGGAFTPARIGEFVGRNIAFQDKTLLEVSVITAVDKYFSLMVTLFSGIFSALIFISYFYKVTQLITITMFILLIALIIISFALMLSEDFWDNMIFKQIARWKIVKKQKEKFRLLRALDRKALTMNLTYSILFFVTFVIQYSFLVSAFSGKLQFINFVWAGSLMFFAKSVIPAISIGELGIREGASIFFLAYFSIGEEVAFNAAFMLFVINVLLPSLTGAILLFFREK